MSAAGKTKIQKSICLISIGLLALAYLVLPLYKYYLYILLWLFPVLGALIAWTAITGWGLDKKHQLHKYNLPLAFVAFGLGGALAGLPFSAYMITEIVTDFQEALAAYKAEPDCRLPPDRSEAILGMATFISGCGQLFWLIWPFSIMEIYNRDRPTLAEIFKFFQLYTFFWAMVGLIPGVNLLLILGMVLVAE